MTIEDYDQIIYIASKSSSKTYAERSNGICGNTTCYTHKGIIDILIITVKIATKSNDNKACC